MLFINIIFQVFNKKLKQKITIFLMHFSLLFIFLGAFLTYFFSYEGLMHLRENESSKFIFSNFDKIEILQGENKKESFKKPKKNMTFSLGAFTFKILELYENADFAYEKAEKGDKVLELYSLKNQTNIILKNEEVEKFKPEKIYSLQMEELKTSPCSEEFCSNVIYELEGSKFISKAYFPQAKEFLKSQLSKKANKALKVEISSKNAKEEFYIFQDENKIFNFEGKEFSFYYGITYYSLPFKIKLKKFEILTYPASQEASDYKSYLEIDGKAYELSMNKVLDYKNFRIFQASFDSLGSVLYVNRDYGKKALYFGYFLLSFTLLLNLFSKSSRFYKIFSSLKSKHFFLIFFLVFSFNKLQANDFQEHLKNLSSLIVQGKDGRLVTFDSKAREFLNKIYGEDKKPEERILTLMTKNVRDENFIKIKNSQLKEALGKEKKLYSYNDFYDENGTFLLEKAYKKAFAKAAKDESKADKEVLKINEKLELLNLLALGELLRIFPNEEGIFLSPFFALQESKGERKEELSALLSSYFSALALENYKKASSALDEIKAYQARNFEKMPSKMRIFLELTYNKIKLNFYLELFFFFNGLCFLFLLFFFREKEKILRKIIKLEEKFYLLALVLFAANFGIRIFLAQHAPSSAYEILLLLALLCLASAYFFSSALTLALASLAASLMLFLANLSFIDAEITNLLPVLSSPYLLFHVFFIILAFALLTLNFFLSFFLLILLAFNKKTFLEESKKISELSLISGLYFLIIGNILGSIWANESWGRYWSWDVKETWTLINILLYTILLHARKLPKLNNVFFASSFSVLAYSSVLMTFFGVNFYFNGLHSYGKSQANLSLFFSFFLVFFSFLIAKAYLKSKKSSFLN